MGLKTSGGVACLGKKNREKEALQSLFRRTSLYHDLTKKMIVTLVVACSTLFLV